MKNFQKRAFKEVEAAQYIGMSRSFLRQSRRVNTVNPPPMVRKIVDCIEFSE